ncbi:ABC-type amino acid transport system permease subunit [Bradyrhizobium sp. LB7.2]
MARSRGGHVNYHWNWGIFFEPNPMGTGTYLDMLLSGLVLTLKTGVLAWIIALIFGTIVGRAAHIAVKDRVLDRLLLGRILP